MRRESEREFADFAAAQNRPLLGFARARTTMVRLNIVRARRVRRESPHRLDPRGRDFR